MDITSSTTTVDDLRDPLLLMEALPPPPSSLGGISFPISLEYFLDEGLCCVGAGVASLVEEEEEAAAGCWLLPPLGAEGGALPPPPISSKPYPYAFSMASSSLSCKILEQWAFSSWLASTGM